MSQQHITSIVTELRKLEELPLLSYIRPGHIVDLFEELISYGVDTIHLIEQFGGSYSLAISSPLAAVIARRIRNNEQNSLVSLAAYIRVTHYLCNYNVLLNLVSAFNLSKVKPASQLETDAISDLCTAAIIHVENAICGGIGPVEREMDLLSCVDSALDGYPESALFGNSGRLNTEYINRLIGMWDCR
jgi:hypothetical protein